MKRGLFTLVYIACWLSTHAQPTYYMSNQTVEDCEGFLLDSEEGEPEGNYDHNENYTFSICVPGADLITLTFSSFCTEAMLDSLRLFDGPDTLSPQIGPTLTGVISIPPISASSGCLTLNFISDPSVNCTGWSAYWEVEVMPPDPPEFLPIDDLPCESTQISLQLAEMVPCVSVFTSAFSISGPVSPTVTSASPVGCVGGQTDQILLSFDPPIDISGDYTVSFTNSVTLCDEVFSVTTYGSFSVLDCPLAVQLFLDSSVDCVGDEAWLIAEASGGNATSYTYSWSPALPSMDTVLIAPTAQTTYVVTVVDGNGDMASDSITLNPLPVPVLSPLDTTVCQSSPDPFFMTAFPPGGSWSGNGIGPGQEMTGLYDPGLVPYLEDTVTYVDINGCSAETFVFFLPLDPGPDHAVCPGEAPFSVSGAVPSGGVWSGSFITPGGLFTPPAIAGDYLITYTHPNGCSGDKYVHVGELVLPPPDTVCESALPFNLSASPFGGLWSGPGITDALLGTFDPADASTGNNLLVYTANGCADTLDMHVLLIDAKWNISSCPEQPPFILPGNWQPNGIGVWSGVGVVDSITGLYDPGLVPNNFNDTLTFSANGCVDKRIVYSRQTTIYVDSLSFCPEEEAIFLDWASVKRTPGGGVWTGAGLTNPSGNQYYFNPGMAGPGTHILFYDINTCQDSMTMIVFPTPQITPDTFCITANPAVLQVTPPGGYWEGPGILNPFSGLFDPEVAGIGTHTMGIYSWDGCYGEGDIMVTPLADAEINGLETYYCYQDTSIFPVLTPLGGSLTIDGVTSSVFNPAAAGPGIHVLVYTVGEAECEDSETWILEVGLPLEVIVPFETDSICPGYSTTLSATASGGFGNYVYTWNQGLGFGQSQFVQPPGTTQYTVTVTDGCSDPAQASLEVFVHSSFSLSYSSGPKVCFEDTTFAQVNVSPEGDYSYVWNTEPAYTEPLLEGNPAFHTVTVTHEETGCETEIDVELPGYGPVVANFSLEPAQGCVNTFDPEVQVLDFSSGGTSGYWDFGDGQPTTPYSFGANINHVYPDTGNYLIQLFIENEGGCASSFEAWTCVEYASRLWAPNAFSPNGDGVNEIFKFVGFEVLELEWEVYNRFGELQFVGSGLNAAWDGKFKGERVPPGVYVVTGRYRTHMDPKEQVYKGFVTVLQ